MAVNLKKEFSNVRFSLKNSGVRMLKDVIVFF